MLHSKKTASDVNVLFSPLLACVSLSALCQLTLNDRTYGFKDAEKELVKILLFPPVSDSAMGCAEAHSCELFGHGCESVLTPAQSLYKA